MDYHNGTTSLLLVVTMDRNFVLYTKGFRQFKDIWDTTSQGFLQQKETQVKLSLIEACYGFWPKLLAHYMHLKAMILGMEQNSPLAHEWVGVYR
jgi:hypothetical protein